ncbi:MAG: 6-oxocyclohex-1-ene-1-carbonyl-CoA hydrolase [uncultured bacterium]|nr:MAG: 6-oxocyclohex-1-ene-1-carbonyl-CoA hydrolase [uncultured bacterium]
MSQFETKNPESFDFNEIIYDKTDWVATITINRPDIYNAYSLITLQEMIQALQDAVWDDGIAVIVLTGAGNKAFCTGGDVKEYASEYIKRPKNFWKWMGVFTQFHDLLRNSGKPTIARINGMVVGGGNEINMSCDLAVAADHATIRQVGTSVGSVAAGGATQFLPIMVGDRRAREILFLNEPISAQKALEWGLVNYVVPYEELDSKVKELAEKLKNKFPECTRYTKQQLNFWKDFAWNSTIGHARDWLSIHFSSLEVQEGMRGFVEKRSPDYMGIRKKAAEDLSSETLWGSNIQECSKCGAKYLPEEFEFCGKCGAEL